MVFRPSFVNAGPLATHRQPAENSVMNHQNLLKTLGFTFTLILSNASAFGSPLALIYKGPGACSAEEGDAGTTGYGCAEADADVAVAAGFQYRFVGPDDLNENSTEAEISALFSPASIWVQPGGISNVAYASMSSTLISSMIRFIENGGGYVGFCAGAFLAADWFYIFPGWASRYSYSSVRADVGYSFEPLLWNGVVKNVYFEGGPYLYALAPEVEVTARFNTGYVVSARSNYGQGRVYITGAHPDAPQVWSQEDGISDPDGSDFDIAINMYRWAAKADGSM